MTIQQHTDILRNPTERPAQIATVEDPRVRVAGDVWRGLIPFSDEKSLQLLALTSSGSWLEIHWDEPTTALGVQFWGDQNDGWARIRINGKPFWEGNTWGGGINFEGYIEIRDLPSDRYTLRVEATGRPGTAGGNIHVTVAALGWGPVGRHEKREHKIFLPFITSGQDTSEDSGTSA